MERWLRISVDVIALAVGVVVLVVVGIRYFAPAPTVPAADQLADQLVGAYIDESAVDVDFAARSRTLLMMLQSDCVYCQQSMPFYRHLLGLQDRADVQTVVVAPPPDTDIGAYLAAEEIVPDFISIVDFSLLPLPVTPTLLLVDTNRRVTHTWVGLLDLTQQAQVVAAVFR